MKVIVYYNLHKHCWSIKAMAGENKGRVIGHASYVEMRDVVGKVSKAGQARVRKEQRKNVHAGIVGDMICFTRASLQTEDDMQSMVEDEYNEITYNPYKYDTFVYKDNGAEFKGSTKAVLINRHVFVR